MHEEDAQSQGREQQTLAEGQSGKNQDVADQIGKVIEVASEGGGLALQAGNRSVDAVDDVSQVIAQGAGNQAPAATAQETEGGQQPEDGRYGGDQVGGQFGVVARQHDQAVGQWEHTERRPP